MQTNPKGRARVYCASRSEGSGCSFKGTFLDVYEGQIEWYLSQFIIPTDYQERILEYHRKLLSSYDNVDNQRRQIEAASKRLEQQYRWGHVSEQEYLGEHRDLENQLNQLSPMDGKIGELKRLAQFLANVADAWTAASEEQKNKLANVLFDKIEFGSGGKVLAVKPKTELEPFFRLSYEHHAKDIGSDPEGI